MTDQRDQAIVPQGESVATAAGAAVTPAMTRRALLRGAAVAAPTILTLSSASAAVALSSVKTYTGVTTPQEDGSYHCLAEESTLGYAPGNLPGNPAALQIGDSPTPIVYQIPERDYFNAPDVAGVAKTEYEMCRDGGNYYYQSGDTWPGVEVKPGILMSADAYGSLGIASIPVQDI